MLLALGLFVLLAGAAAAGGTNRTIDDEAGDSVTGLSPQYLGTSTASWNYGPTCGCTVRPDASSCFNGSWHDATVHNGATVSVLLSFNGTAIYFYGIVPNTVAGADTTVNLTFTLDGKPAGTFFHAPDATNDIAYNVALFSQAGLANGEHQLTATATPGPTVPSLILFDYAIYTYEEFVSPSSSTSASASSTSSTFPSSTTTAAAVVHHHTLDGAIGGAVGGGLVVIAALLALLFCLRRRRRPDQPAPAMATTTEMAHSPPHPDVGAGGMDPYAGHYMPPPAAYGTAPMWTSSSSAPKQSGSAYGPASYAKSGPGSYVSRDMVGANSYVAPLVDSGHVRTPFSHAPSSSAGRSSTDALSASSARGGLHSPTFALPSDVSTSTAPGSSAAPSSSPQVSRRLPPPPVQGTTMRRHDTLLTRGGTIKTMSEVPPAYAPGWDST